MMNRLNQILIGVLVLQIALAVYAFWPQNAAQAGGGPLLADFDVNEVVGLTIEDNNDNRLVLAKTGDEWVLPEAEDFPVDGEKVSPFLEKFEEIETNRLVTRTEASHKRLAVAGDDFNRRVELAFADGDSHNVYLGSSAGAGATHVRLDDQSEVYLTAALTSFDANAQAATWIDTLYFTVPQTATVALTLENDSGLFEFEKDGDIWTMKGLAEDETFNESSLTTLLNQATSVRMTAPIGQEEEASFGLDEPQAVVTIQTEEDNASKRYTLTIGAQDEADNSYVVASSESPYYVRVAEFTANIFVDKTREDFLAVEEEDAEADDATLDVSGSE